jgi:hypothetical protein
MSSSDKTTNIGHIAAKNTRDINTRVKYSAGKDREAQRAALARPAGGGGVGNLHGDGGNLANEFFNQLLNPELKNQSGPARGQKKLPEQTKNEKIDGTNPNFLALKEQEAKKYEIKEGDAGEYTFHFAHPTAGQVEVKVKKQGDRFLVFVDMQQALNLKERRVLGQMMSKMLSADLGKNMEVVIG